MNKPQSSSVNTVAIVVVVFVVLGCLLLAALIPIGALFFYAGVRADQGQIQPDITVAVPAQAEFNELAQQLEQRLDEAAVTHELRIYCDATGQAFISDAHVSLEQIREQVAGWDSVHIEADANCKHATVQTIATICTEQGVANVTTSVATGSENAEQAPVAEDAP